MNVSKAQNVAAVRGLLDTSRSAFLLVCFISFFSFPTFSQSRTNSKNHEIEFGHSLDKYNNPKKKPVQAIKTDALSGDETIKISTNMVVTNVLVVNREGKAIVGLKKDDFLITEEGIRQETDLFAPGNDVEIPKKIVLIIELGAIPIWGEHSIDAAKILVDKLGPKDQMAIASTGLKLLTNFTSDKLLLKAKLEDARKEILRAKRLDDSQMVEPLGMYNYSTLIAVLNELFTKDDRRPIIVQQTSGDEVFRLRPILERAKRGCEKTRPWGCERKFGLPEVIDEVEKSRATIYTVVSEPQVIGLNHDEQIMQVRKYIDMLFLSDPERFAVQYPTEKSRDEYKRLWGEKGIPDFVRTESPLIDITGSSGGYTSFFEKAEEIDDIYNMIFKSIQYQYTIGYYPKNEPHDGARRSVKIEVRGHPEYRVIGRKTYFAPEN